MKTAYTFVTLRYVHDVVTGEFANVGVVLYAPQKRHLEARFTTSYERLNALFLKIDHGHYRNLIRYLGHRFEELASEVRDGLNLVPLQGIEELVRRVLPKDDSSLQWSPPGGGFSDDPGETMAEIYARMVERYSREKEVSGVNDEDIARHFTSRLKAAAGKLEEKRIEAADYQHVFPHAWKNAIWHLYQPVSFDLVDPGNIVEKANRWLGRGVALSDSQDAFKIHFLLGAPKRPGMEKAFESAQHLLAKIPVQKELIAEGDRDAFADSVAADMVRHPRTPISNE
ncbi:MAG: DUF3037 domain-containing protein [Verrucomicrobiota bacterium]|jgi:hypothetical protein